jgi:hypothetical protein
MELRTFVQLSRGTKGPPRLGARVSGPPEDGPANVLLRLTITPIYP